MYQAQTIDYLKHGSASVLVMVDTVQNYLISRQQEINARSDPAGKERLLNNMVDLINLMRFSDDLLNIWSHHDLDGAKENIVGNRDLWEVIEPGVFFLWAFATPESINVTIDALVNAEIASRLPVGQDANALRTFLTDIYHKHPWIVFCQLVRLTNFSRRMDDILGESRETAPPV